MQYTRGLLCKVEMLLAIKLEIFMLLTSNLELRYLFRTYVIFKDLKSVIFNGRDKLLRRFLFFSYVDKSTKLYKKFAV